MSEGRSYVEHVESFEDLKVWQVGMSVAESVYEVTKSFPPDERFGVIAQTRSAAVSIPSNIAEGWGRGPGASNVNFGRIARGSTFELRTLLLLAQRLGYGDGDAITALLKDLMELSKLVNAYVRAMEGNLVREASREYSAAGFPDDLDPNRQSPIANRSTPTS